MLGNTAQGGRVAKKALRKQPCTRVSGGEGTCGGMRAFRYAGREGRMEDVCSLIDFRCPPPTPCGGRETLTVGGGFLGSPLAVRAGKQMEKKLMLHSDSIHSFP